MRERERESYYSVVGAEESRWDDLRPRRAAEINLPNTWHKYNLLFFYTFRGSMMTQMVRSLPETPLFSPR